jgi:AcrR family transcriptional regulator
MAGVTNLPRYQRRREKTRHELLTAAKKTLAEKGFHNTKITDIAQAANIGVGTFYLYYETKEVLFLELVKETAPALREEIERARATMTSPTEKMRVATLTFFRFAQANRELFKIIFGHGNTFNTLLRQVYETFVTDAIERITDGIQQQAFRPLPPPVVANALVGMSAQVVSWWIEQDQLSAEEMADTMTDFIFHGLTWPSHV